MDIETHLMETKMLLKSIAIGYSDGINIKQLIELYYDYEGKSVPHKEFGYESLIAFLKSMPDVIKVRGSAFDAKNVRIYAVNDANTDHISEMVARQKPSIKRAFNTPSKRIRTLPVFTANYNKYKTDRKPIMKQQPIKAFNRENLITNIQSILRDSLNGTYTSTGIINEYYKRFGERLPHNWIQDIKHCFDVSNYDESKGIVTPITIIALKMNTNCKNGSVSSTRSSPNML